VLSLQWDVSKAERLLLSTLSCHVTSFTIFNTGCKNGCAPISHPCFILCFSDTIPKTMVGSNMSVL